MKKTYPTTKKARCATGWHKHLKPEGKRRANKGTRKVIKLMTQLGEAVDNLP
jgi:hypothetical protein